MSVAYRFILGPDLKFAQPFIGQWWHIPLTTMRSYDLDL